MLNRQTQWHMMAAVGVVALLLAFCVWQFGAAQATPGSAIIEGAPPKPTFYDSPDDYNLAAIEADPAGYYSQVVPSRVWQRAPPPAGRERHEEILIVGEAYRFVVENEQLAQPLAVRAKPARPVTFTALDQGKFANGEISITVRADNQGYAQVEFWVAGPGGYRVLAGSPENQGPAEFVIRAFTAAELADLQDRS